MKVFIYALFDPRSPDKIKYVGKTGSLSARVAQHSRGTDHATKIWVNSLRKESIPIAHKILEISDETHSSDHEAKWVKAYRSEDLLNVQMPVSVFDFNVTPIASLDELEKKYIIWTIAFFAGNKLAAAKSLGIGRQTLYNKIKALKIET